MVPAVTATYGSSTPFVLGSVTLSPVLLSFSIQKKKKKGLSLLLWLKMSEVLQNAAFQF